MAFCKQVYTRQTGKHFSYFVHKLRIVATAQFVRSLKYNYAFERFKTTYLFCTWLSRW